VRVVKFAYGAPHEVLERDEREDRRDPAGVEVDAAPGSRDFSQQSLEFCYEMGNPFIVQIGSASFRREGGAVQEFPQEGRAERRHG
jgi:hypothetical protein